MNKASLLADLTPLPHGYTGDIKIVAGELRVVGAAAILSYDMEESETVFGQKLSAR